MNYTSISKHPEKTHNWKYSDEELTASASQFKHRSEWKREANKHYQAAYWRGILDLCCAHMQPMASPYAADYEIYAYEFEDRHAYVGLTFLPVARTFMHKVRGPVAEHAKLCRTYTRRSLETGITREQAPDSEKRWIERYRSEGWILLNKNSGGTTGTVRGRKWTKELVIADAKRFATKQAWIDGSQGSYRIAKREGWFAEASAHMPKRKLGVGAGRTVSQVTRDKQSAAKSGKTQSADAKQAKSVAITKWWTDRKSSKVAEVLIVSS